MTDSRWLCVKCHRSIEEAYREQPCFNKIQIYQRTLKKLCSTDDYVSSHVIADELKQDYHEVQLVMTELRDAYPSCFELKRNSRFEPILISDAGKRFLERPLIQAMENGITAQEFFKFYPLEIISISLDRDWVELNERQDTVAAGAEKEECKEFYEMLKSFKEQRPIPDAMHRELYDNGLLQLGTIIHDLEIKKRNGFPTEKSMVVHICIRMIKHYLSSLNEVDAK